MKNNLQGSAADDDDEDELKDDDEAEIIFFDSNYSPQGCRTRTNCCHDHEVHLSHPAKLSADDDDDFSITITINSIIRRRQAHCVRFTYTFIGKPHGAVDLIRGFIIALF